MRQRPCYTSHGWIPFTQQDKPFQTMTREKPKEQKVPSIRLTYFDLKGRAELARLCFVYGGVGFVDRRISKEKWTEVKSKTPLGQLPVLEIDGHKICQSR